MMRIISGLLKGRLLKRPPATITRPTGYRVRESIFNILQHLDGFEFDGSMVLDLFAGSGAMGIESLSRGAKQATFVESNRSAYRVIAENMQLLKLTDKSNILCCDVLRIPKLNTKFDLIFIDPPYLQDLEAPTFKQLVVQDFLKSGTIVVLEHSKSTPFEPIDKIFLPLTRRTFSNTAISIFKVFYP